MVAAMDLIRRIKDEKGNNEESKKPAMFYLPAGLEAEFRALVGPGHASQVIEALIRECITNAENEGLISEIDRKRMTLARSRALSKKGQKRNAPKTTSPEDNKENEDLEENPANELGEDAA